MKPYLLNMLRRIIKCSRIIDHERGNRFLGGVYHSVLVRSSSRYEQDVNTGLVMIRTSRCTMSHAALAVRKDV
jgi:hypothetical protein